MSIRLIAVALLAVSLAIAGCDQSVAMAPEHPASASRLFTVVGDYSLGPSVNRMDYESIDPIARRLYIAKMGSGQLLVFDIDNNKLVSTLDGFPKVTGVLVVPELHKVYASVPGGGLLSSISQGLGMAGLSSGHGQVAIRDTLTLKEIARLPGGVFPDGIAHDPNDHRIYVSDEMGGALTVIDADVDKFISRINTDGEVGNVRFDPASGDLFVPVQSHNELIRIAPPKGSVRARYQLAGCDHPHGFIITTNGGIGYVACDGNDLLMAVDLASGHILDKQPVAHDPDVLAIDPAANRLYVAAESGNLSTYNIATPKKPVSLGEVFIATGAHSVAVDPVSHRLYVALANLNDRAFLRVLMPKSN